MDDIVPKQHWYLFFHVQWEGWINLNLIRSGRKFEAVDWPETFGLGCWLLWKWRNAQVHNGDMIIPCDLRAEILKYKHQYQMSREGYTGDLVSEEFIWVAWNSPETGWFKLNTEGAWESESQAGGGGLIQGDTGEWIRGFTSHLSAISPGCTEALALLEGLMVAQDMNITKIEVEVDAQELIDAILGKKDLHGGSWIIEQIQCMLRNWEFKLQHTHREANRCADALAKMGKIQRKRKMIWTTPPLEVQSIIQEDCEGRNFLRRVN